MTSEVEQLRRQLVTAKEQTRVLAKAMFAIGALLGCSPAEMSENPECIADALQDLLNAARGRA